MGFFRSVDESENIIRAGTQVYLKFIPFSFLKMSHFRYLPVIILVFLQRNWRIPKIFKWTEKTKLFHLILRVRRTLRERTRNLLTVINDIFSFINLWLIETLEQPPPYQQNENQTINGNDVIGNSKNGKWKKGKVINQYIYFQACNFSEMRCHNQVINRVRIHNYTPQEPVE